MELHVIRAKRLRSGFTHVHFKLPVVKVTLSDGRTDGRILGQTEVSVRHQQEDADTWNYKTTVWLNRLELLRPTTILRFEVSDMADNDMYCIREFSGLDLRALILKDGTVKKGLKLPGGGGIPKKDGKAPSIHVGLQVIPNPYLRYKRSPSPSGLSKSPSEHASSARIKDITTKIWEGTGNRPAVVGGGGGGGSGGGGGGTGQNANDRGTLTTTKNSGTQIVKDNVLDSIVEERESVTGQSEPPSPERKERKSLQQQLQQQQQQQQQKQQQSSDSTTSNGGDTKIYSNSTDPITHSPKNGRRYSLGHKISEHKSSSPQNTKNKEILGNNNKTTIVEATQLETIVIESMQAPESPQHSVHSKTHRQIQRTLSNHVLPRKVDQSLRSFSGNDRKGRVQMTFLLSACKNSVAPDAAKMFYSDGKLSASFSRYFILFVNISLNCVSEH